MTIPDAADFIRANTVLRAAPLVPEIKLHLADEAVPLWRATEEELGALGLPPPFWAFAWAGGQALARYVLDRPPLVEHRRVLDLAAGSGLVGIAAMLAGAAHVVAADIDAFARVAIALNAAASGVDVTPCADDLLAATAPPRFEVVLAGDIFYEQDTAAAALAFLDAQRQSGATVLIGDPGRAFLPKDRLRELAVYQVPVTRELEDMDIRRTSVWALR